MMGVIAVLVKPWKQQYVRSCAHSMCCYCSCQYEHEVIGDECIPIFIAWVGVDQNCTEKKCLKYKLTQSLLTKCDKITEKSYEKY